MDIIDGFLGVWRGTDIQCDSYEFPTTTRIDCQPITINFRQPADQLLNKSLLIHFAKHLTVSARNVRSLKI